VTRDWFGRWIGDSSPGWINRRAGGRRRYNALRQLDALRRRAELALALRRMRGSPFARGTQTRLARRFGAHKSTISRDMAWLLEQWIAADRRRAGARHR
jgi:hypothetical protein